MGVGKRVVDAYRWRRLLASCRLDPKRLRRPVEPPGNGDFIIAGCPRSGTSLLAAQLFQPPSVVTVMEPWDGLRLEPGPLFRSLRGELERGVLHRGRLDIAAISSGRVEWQHDAERSHAVSVAPGFQLGVKWPTFWQYLDFLPETRFLVTIRHPAEVISSFARVGGRLSRGLEYDVRFNADMNRYLAQAAKDDETRRILLYEYVNSRLLPHLERPNVLTVRYERWQSDPAGLMSEIGAFLEVDLGKMPVTIEAMDPQPPPARLMGMIEEMSPSARELGYVD